MGLIDWLTTIVGIGYFGAVEGNPFMAGLVQTNLLAFTAMKLGTAFFIGLLFYGAEKTLNSHVEPKSPNFIKTRFLLRAACLVSISILAFAVVNNVLIVTRVAF